MIVTRIQPSAPDHLIRDPELLAPDTSDREMAETQVRDGHLRNTRWIVDVPGLKSWGPRGGMKMWTPCCTAVRRPVWHGDAVRCPTCGWWWRLHCLGWTNRIVSLGKEIHK